MLVFVMWGPEVGLAGPCKGVLEAGVGGWALGPAAAGGVAVALTSFLYPQLHFDPEACSFRELLLEDGYNIYQSEARGLPLRLPPGPLTRDLPPWGPARFLPLPGLPPAPPEPPGGLAPAPPDVGSSDPLSMVWPSQGRSPSYTS